MAGYCREKKTIYLAYIQLQMSKTKNIYPCTLSYFFFSLVCKYFILPSWPTFSFPFRLSKVYLLTTTSASSARSMFQKFLCNCLFSEELLSLYQVSHLFGSLGAPYGENSQTMTWGFFNLTCLWTALS